MSACDGLAATCERLCCSARWPLPGALPQLGLLAQRRSERIEQPQARRWRRAKATALRSNGATSGPELGWQQPAEGHRQRDVIAVNTAMRPGVAGGGRARRYVGWDEQRAPQPAAMAPRTTPTTP